MKQKLNNYLNMIFSDYEDIKIVRELKEELLTDLTEKLEDLKRNGHDYETAYTN